MIKNFGRVLFFLLVPVLFGVIILMAQDDASADNPDNPECDPGYLRDQQAILAADLATESTPEQTTTMLYHLGILYQTMALDCGYQPSDAEVNALIEMVLSLSDLETVIAAQSIGTDVPAILLELDSVDGDSYTGQLLYNGIEPGLDGEFLGCAGCHQGETAPLTGATWTRIVQERMSESQFAEYTPEQYAIESIVLPEHYLVPDYQNVMPPNFGSRLDIQQLADLLAFLQSHDEGLED